MRKDLGALIATTAGILIAGCQTPEPTRPGMLQTPGLSSTRFYSESDRGHYTTTSAVYQTSDGPKEAYVLPLDLTGKIARDSQKNERNVLPIALIPIETATRELDMDGRIMAIKGRQYVLTQVGNKGIEFTDNGTFTRIEETTTIGDEERTIQRNGAIQIKVPVRYIQTPQGTQRYFELSLNNNTTPTPNSLKVVYIPVSTTENQISATVNSKGEVHVKVKGPVYQPTEVNFFDAPKPVEPTPVKPAPIEKPIPQITITQ